MISAPELMRYREIRRTFSGTLDWCKDCMKFSVLSYSLPELFLNLRISAAPFLLKTVVAWENDRMAELTGRLSRTRAKVGSIVAMVLALAIATWLTPVHLVVLHNILHHLNILPLMLAGMLFGWRGAVQTLLLATILQSASIYRHWHDMPLDAQDQVVELSTFGVAGVIAGVMADRERMQRLRVEATKLELERVYIELTENLQHLKKTERLTAAGQLAASLAHEIRNPLASISGAAGILARGQAPPESREECLDILMKESLRLNKLLTNFLDFAKPRLPRLQWTDPISIIQSVTVLTQHLAVRQDVSLVQETQGTKREIECDAEQMKQVLLNLILNGVQATEPGGMVVIRASETTKHLLIQVVDEGRGIADEDLERIFDPFFTTKENGTGLGLAVAQNIMAQHGGSITCRRNGARKKGMIFEVQLTYERETKLLLNRAERQLARL
jgi:two-component system sensor histidine kinase HydH